MRKFSWIFIVFHGLLLHAQQPQQKPNVLIIFADDLGWADLSCYGSTFYETPHLDKMAKGGTQFLQGYATSPVCSPTRASLFTGKYPVKTGVTDWIPGRQADGNTRPFEKMKGPKTGYELPLQETTLAEWVTAYGYRTFFAGKWHLGEDAEHWPEYQGFQQNMGGWSKGGPTGRKNDSTGGFFTPYANPRLPDGPAGEYLTDRLATECISFIKEQGTNPFLMVYSLYAVHNPLQAPRALVEKYTQKRAAMAGTGNAVTVKDEKWMANEEGWKRRIVQNHPVYAAMIENMDQNIGRIMQALEEKGILDNTLIIFTSDNGGLSTAEGSPTVNAHLRAGKGWLFEGGIRVPFLMYWKGKLTGGRVTDMPVTVADIFPTVAAVVDPGRKPAADIDGKNILHLLQDTLRSHERTLYWHYPHYSNQGGRPGAAIRQGKWKLIYYYEDSSVALYNLSDDPSERDDLSSRQTAICTQLRKKLMLWLKKNRASAPVENAAYIPEKDASR